MDRVSEGYPYFLSARLDLGAQEADEITVGPVWGPALIETLQIEAGAQPVVVRLFAYPGRLPTRVALTTEAEVLGEKIVTTATDDGSAAGRGGLRVGAPTVTGFEITLGRLVPWGPWWLVARVENETAGANNCALRFSLRVFDRDGMTMPAFWERGLAGHVAYSAARGLVS